LKRLREVIKLAVTFATTIINFKQFIAIKKSSFGR